MGFLVLIFSMTMAVIGAYGLASPAGLASFARRWEGQLGLWIGATVRILFGVALWRKAPSSHTPAVLEGVGAIALISGMVLPLVGVERLSKLISWWSGQSSTFIRGWSVVAIALGLFLFWSAAA